jgi:hypothetical protein
MNEEIAPLTKQALIACMNEGLSHFLAFLDHYSAEQLEALTDAVGWNARDHITHLAAWADGIAALLRREDRWAAVGISKELGESQEDDVMNEANEVIAAQHRHLSAAEACQWLVAAHKGLVAAIEPLEDADLLLPYERFVAPFTGDGGRPIMDAITADSYEHYQEHGPWIESFIPQA